MSTEDRRPPESTTDCEKCSWEQERIAEKPDFGSIIPEKKHIEQFMHCGMCLRESGDDPYQQQLEVGWTIHGIQVWCRRHDANIMHISFEGSRHPSASGVHESWLEKANEFSGDCCTPPEEKQHSCSSDDELKEQNR